jgi:hypothetical protein
MMSSITCALRQIYLECSNKEEKMGRACSMGRREMNIRFWCRDRRKGRLGMLRRRLNDNIKMDLGETVCVCRD